MISSLLRTLELTLCFAWILLGRQVGSIFRLKKKINRRQSVNIFHIVCLFVCFHCLVLDLLNSVQGARIALGTSMDLAQTGVMMFRNTSWTLEFLKAWHHMGYKELWSPKQPSDWSLQYQVSYQYDIVI
jgi:hypothetical protein